MDWKKVIRLTRRLQFLGLVLDYNRRVIELPGDKLSSLVEKYTKCFKAEKVSKLDLQSLVGSLCFGVRAIRAAKTFSRMFIDVMASLKEPHHQTRVTALLRSEFLCWIKVAPLLNGISPTVFGTPGKRISINTDVSFRDFGALMGNSWVARAWNSRC